MDSTRLHVDTPEQVTLSFELAGLGSRCLALALDMLFQGFAFWLLFVGFLATGSYLSGNGSSLYTAAMILAAALLFFVYFIVFEGILHGRTPGKILCGLRVIRRDGRPLGWAGATVRNLFRLLDFLPSFYAVGVVSMFLSAESRRIGDFVAGTVVVRDTRARAASLIALRSAAQSAGPGRLSRYPLRESERVLIRDLLSRRAQMDRRTFDALCRRIAQPLFEKFHIPPPNRVHSEGFLRMLWEENQGL
ncbi:MAG: RDD family protein [Oscillospiraceae bacterium]|nr:RDD family protein [Oscillospiraceae bacterium]